MTLPENYNILIIQEYTDQSMIMQYISNAFILNIKTHIYTITQQIHNTNTQTHT